MRNINMNTFLSECVQISQAFIQMTFSRDFVVWSGQFIKNWLTVSCGFYGIFWAVATTYNLDGVIELLTGTHSEVEEHLHNLMMCAITLGFATNVLFIFYLFVRKKASSIHFYYCNIILLLALLGGTIGHVQADPCVIADFGGESAVRYYDSIQPVHTDDAPQHPHAVPQTFSEKDLLPIVSHKWQVGSVEPKPINLPGVSPLFLIGADDVSRQWLSQNREKLASLQAVGFVINITTEAELAELRQIAPELTLMLSAADNLAERLDLYHYPVLITTEGISQ